MRMHIELDTDNKQDEFFLAQFFQGKEPIKVETVVKEEKTNPVKSPYEYNIFLVNLITTSGDKTPCYVAVASYEQAADLAFEKFGTPHTCKIELTIVCFTRDKPVVCQSGGYITRKFVVGSDKKLSEVYA